MNTQKQLTENQKKAIEIVQNLVKEEKINFNDAFQLIVAIYENESEFIYVPYQNPYVEPYRPYTSEPWTSPAPWLNPVWANNANNAYADPNHPDPNVYLFGNKTSGVPEQSTTTAIGFKVGPSWYMNHTLKG